MSSYKLFIEDDSKNPTTNRDIGRALGQFLPLVILFAAFQISFSSFVEGNSYPWAMFMGMALLAMGLFVLAGKLNFIVHLILAVISVFAMYFMSTDVDSDGKISSWLLILVSAVSLAIFIYVLWIGMKSMPNLHNIISVGGIIGSILVLFSAFYCVTA